MMTMSASIVSLDMEPRTVTDGPSVSTPGMATKVVAVVVPVTGAPRVVGRSLATVGDLGAVKSQQKIRRSESFEDRMSDLPTRVGAPGCVGWIRADGDWRLACGR